MKILIIGASGFLGNAVASRLAREGHQVVGMVRNPGRRKTDPRIEYVQANLDDAQVISDIANDADYLMHFAWDTTPGTSIGQPTAEAVNNLLPTLQLIEQLQSLSKCKLVFVSSAGAVYDETGADRVVETSSLNPKSYYGAGKLAVEMFLRAYSAQTAHPVVIVRPTNVYGPGQQTKRQFGIVPTLMHAISDGSSFNVWGDGEATRDYLYIDDLAEFFAVLTEKKWKGVNLFNLASGQSCSINALCELLQEVSGKQLTLKRLPERGVDLRGVPVDCSRAKSELAWQATTELDVGLAKTWKWFVSSR